MAIKAAIGKGITVSQPAKGTVKKSSPVTSTIGISPSKKSKKDEGGIERKESAPPAEILSVTDFNRVYSSADRNRVERTPYGSYYGALDSIHSITTDDVSYVISKALENDSSGEWGTRKSTVDADVAEADDLVSDLSAFLNSLEKMELALDFGRASDVELQTAAEEYLDLKLKSVETPASERKFEAKEVLDSLYDRDSNIDCLRRMLSSLRETLMLENESTYRDFLKYVGQTKRRINLNPDTSSSMTDLWNRTQSLSTDTAKRITACSEILSQIFSISTGIPRVKSDAVSSKISLNLSDPGAIFNGTSAWARSGKTKKADSLPFRKTLAAAGPSSVLPALYMLQVDAGSIPIIPVELEDSSTSPKYRSGLAGLVRDPLLAGEFEFTKLTNFSQTFEESRQNIETYLELILGRCDPNNKITPMEITRTVIKNFADGLKLAVSDTSSLFQLLVLSAARKTFTAGAAGAVPTSGLDHAALRIAGRIKHYQLKNSSSSSATNEESVSKTSLTTTKVSSGSESLKDDATVTTSQTEDKSGISGDRVIRRSAGASPEAEAIAADLFDKLVITSNDGPGNADSISAALDEQRVLQAVYKSLKEYPDSWWEFTIDEVLDTFFDTLSKQLKNTLGDNLITIPRYRSQQQYIDKFVEIAADVKELEDQLASAKSGKTVDYIDKDTVKTYFEECQSATSGTFMSTIVAAYDEILDAALSRLPDGEKLVDSSGFTRYFGLDEFALLSLIVECYIALASQLQMSSVVDDRSNPTGMNITSVTTSMISNYADELNSIVSDDDDSALLNSTAPSKTSTPAWDAVKICMGRQERYQNILAFLSAYSSILSNSRDSLIASINDLLNGDNRQAAFNTPRGREVLSNLTTQQIVYRKYLLDKYRPDSDYGYLPARVRYSNFETEALNTLLASSGFSSRNSENSRIIFVGVPAGLINNSKRYTDENIGEVNRTGMIEVIIHRKDQELDDLIFKEKIFLFDPQLYLSPGAFDDFAAIRKGGDLDIMLSIAKRAKFSMYDRDTKETLQYSNLSSHPRYAQLTSNQIEQVAKNAVISYLMESYIYKITGAIFDETLSLNIDDSTSETGRAALITTAGLGLTDLVLPTADQINSIFGNDGEVNFILGGPELSTGDKELIAGLTSSYLMRNDTLVNRVLLPSKFDRVMAVVIDPDDFEIDKTESINRNGEAASNMLQSLTKQGLLIDGEKLTKIIPRDPLSGGFSIGSVSCQFSPHTASSESGTLLRITKEFAISKTSLSSQTIKFKKTGGLNTNSASSRTVRKLSSGSISKISSSKLKR